MKYFNLLNPSLITIKAKPAVFTLLLLCLSFLLAAQPGQVTFRLDMSGIPAEEVGIKGSVSPLSWDEAYPLSDEDGDGIYEAEVTFDTSDQYVTFKFVKDGELELEGADNRILRFDAKPIQKVYAFNEFGYYSEEQLRKLIFTAEQIKEDVAILSEIIQYIHPAPYKYIDSLSLRSHLEQLERELIRQPDLASAYKAISSFLARIKCSHTFTNPWNQNSTIRRAIFYPPNKLPFTFNRIGKQLFIDKNASESQKLERGLKIQRINGVAVDSILSKLTEYVTADGNNYEKKLQRLSLTGTEKYSLFDIFYPLVFGSYEQFELELKDFYTGKSFYETVKAISKTRRTEILKQRYPSLETSLRDGWNFRLVNDSTGLLQVKSFVVYRNEFDWKAIIDDAFDELNDKRVPNLIIDIRENEGGQGEVGEYILQRVIKKPFTAPAIQSSVRYLSIPEQYRKYIGTWDKFPYDFNNKVSRREKGRYLLKTKFSTASKTYKPHKNGYKGRVFLITDASNSSATHLMAAYAQQTGEITLVGQETGGNQLGTNGSFMFFLNLPHTGIEVDIPVINMIIPPMEGEARDGGIRPDIAVEKTWEGLVMGKDTELEMILSLING